MKHGEEIAYWEDSSDPELWWGLATPMDLWLAWQNCKCEALCRCDVLEGKA